LFNLDRTKNDTSATLDLLRAVAAQMVCVGHALNFGSGSTLTLVPNIGVLFFFLLSGFLIAHTLASKSQQSDYGLIEFGIERFARIYTAFFPALVLIAAADYLMQSAGIPMPDGPTDLQTLFGNLTMRQGLQSRWGVATFGSAGQLTSIAVEFHIYFFVGAIFFLLKGERVLFCLLVAVLFARMPLDYFSNIQESDRTLFAMWLAGFAVYYVARATKPELAAPAAIGFIVMIWYWARHRTPNDYDLSNYPPLALAFLALVICTQHTRFLGYAARRVIGFAADYSLSLFLIHLTISKIVLRMPGPAPLRIATAIILSNVLAIGFAFVFERHYRGVAGCLKRLLHPNVAPHGEAPTLR
jgi:peptidoglycan/LPS O-acetylase OafA/YrhL